MAAEKRDYVTWIRALALDSKKPEFYSWLHNLPNDCMILSRLLYLFETQLLIHNM